MVAVSPDAEPKPTARSRFGGSSWRGLTNIMPKGLYARALIIIIAPMVLLQSVVAFVFMERHWETVTRRLSTVVTGDIAMLIDVYNTYPHTDGYEALTRMARERLRLSVQILPDQDLPPARPKPFFALLDRTLSREISQQIGLPFWIDTVGRSQMVEIRIKLDDAVMRVLARRSQAYASNSHIFLLWMVGTSLVLLLIAVLFLRNQIRPILRLAEAAEDFGMGRPGLKEFQPRGAREVRKASHAFMQMRDRIERQIEQRTTMLAGVSHDLRTILTRFKLELAMFGTSVEADALRADVDEMQAMLEDYMSFARGDSGEESVQTNIRELMTEIWRDAARTDKAVTLDSRQVDIEVPLRRHAFKRAVANVVNNATRHADRVCVTASQSNGVLRIVIDDDGPGVPEDQREAVFRPFYRLDESRSQAAAHTGLGLSIARDIVRGHGGDILLDYSPLGGLRAIIQIPV